MAFNPFTNGKRVARRMMLMELASASLILALVQFLVNLPSQDWIPEVYRKQLAFAVGTAVTLLKAGEMFFNRSAMLYRDQGDTDRITKPPIIK